MVLAAGLVVLPHQVSHHSHSCGSEWIGTCTQQPPVRVHRLTPSAASGVAAAGVASNGSDNHCLQQEVGCRQTASAVCCSDHAAASHCWSAGLCSLQPHQSMLHRHAQPHSNLHNGLHASGLAAIVQNLVSLPGAARSWAGPGPGWTGCWGPCSGCRISPAAGPPPPSACGIGATTRLSSHAQTDALLHVIWRFQSIVVAGWVQVAAAAICLLTATWMERGCGCLRPCENRKSARAGRWQEVLQRQDAVRPAPQVVPQGSGVLTQG